jgi:hypothetical protein
MNFEIDGAYDSMIHLSTPMLPLMIEKLTKLLNR